MEDFVQSLTAQLDRAQDALALQARTGRPLTFALKDLSLDLRVFCESDQSLTDPMQFDPSITGSCETSCRAMSPIAWRTVAPGATLTTEGALPFFLPSTVCRATFGVSSIWFSRIHSSL
jgi:hypothetical protein